jgi:hypothetical protein
MAGLGYAAARQLSIALSVRPQGKRFFGGRPWRAAPTRSLCENPE